MTNPSREWNLCLVEAPQVDALGLARGEHVALGSEPLRIYQQSSRGTPPPWTRPTHDLGLADPAITRGRGHCLIWVDDGVVTVEDLGSDNGTWVQQPNAEPIKLRPKSPAVLGAGDIVIVGRCRFSVVALDSRNRS